MVKQRNLSLFPKLAYQDPNSGLEYQYLGRQGLEIVNKLIEQYRYYDGQHWIDSAGREVTPERLKASNNLDYQPTMLTANLTAWFIDRLAAFMFERSIGLACTAEQIDDSADMAKPDYQPSDAQQKASDVAGSREYLLYRIKKANLLDEKLLKAAADYHIGGAVCAKLHYDPRLGLRVIWRPRLEFWPIYDADDVDLLEKIHFTAFIDEDTIWKQSCWLQDGSCWMEEALYDTQLKLKEQLVAPTDLKLPFIPVEIFNRGGLTGETEGRSLVDVLKGLNEEIEAKLSDNADSLRFGMFVIKVILNAMLPSAEDIKAGTAEPLHIAPNALWSLTSDGETPADAKTLEHNFNYKEALKDHLDTALHLMHRLANVPEMSPERVTGLGNMSGFALRILYGPIISETNKSMTTWKPRVQRLFGKALFMLNKFETRNHYDQSWISDADLGAILPGDLDDIVEVKTSMPIPENETEALERETKKVAVYLESLKGAMDALGVENPEAKLAEILSEKAALRESLGGVADEPGEGGGDGE